MNARDIHVGLGLDAMKLDNRQFLIRLAANDTIRVRTVGWLGWVIACLFGFSGVVIRQSERAPRVLVDWETYVRIAMGLHQEALPEMTDGDEVDPFNPHGEEWAQPVRTVRVVTKRSEET